MPFNKMDVFNSIDIYKKELKKELGKLDSTLGEFFFYDEFPVNGGKEPLLVVGDVKPPVLKSLKDGAKARAQGQCFVEGSTLKMTLTKGKMPEVKLKPIFKGIPFDFKMISGDLDAGATADSDERFENRLKSVKARFDKIKGQISSEQSKELVALFGHVNDAKDTDTTAAGKALTTLDTRMQEIIKQSVPAEASREETNTRKRLAATTARFDKVKGHLTDDERKELRILFGSVVDTVKAEDWSEAYKTLEGLDKKMVAMVREAVKDSENDTESRTADTEAAKKQIAAKSGIADKIKKDSAALEKVQKAITHQNVELDTMRNKMRGLKSSKVAAQETKIANGVKNLAKLAENLSEVKASLEKNVKVLKAANLGQDKVLVMALGTIQKRIKTLETMLDDVPIDQARANLEATVKKMAEASEWHEEQLEKEAGGGEGHGASRHGAQTGMDRQGRRAATADGVTPEQSDNPSGATQSVVWNKVKITYTEEGGKRVVENRTKLAQSLASEISNTQFSGGNASMWANPVLEKEAFDKAMAVGRILKNYTHYANGNKSSAGQVATNFNNLTVILPKPASGPGWGYAVTRKGAAIEPVVATKVLKLFEDGVYTLDELYKYLNVELIEKPNKGGVKMITHCKVILTRATENDDWRLKTHYPDNNLTASNEGWEAERNQAKGDVTLLHKDDTIKVFNNKVLPA